MTAMLDHTVLVVIDDLFFLSKVQTTLSHLGLPAKIVTNVEALGDFLHTATPALVVVDLTLRTAEAVALIKTIRLLRPSPQPPILAFAPHVAVELQQQALQAGAQRVVAKSEFSKHLAELIRQYVQGNA